MRKYLCLLFLCCYIASTASTSISTSTVSGHWTTAGSPYMVFNDILISGSTSLVIDPGVTVIFQGPYRVKVSGILYASGTAANPITFTINDTTGFTTNTTTSAGGWHGFGFGLYSGSSADSSLLKYCNIYYTKMDSATYSSLIAAFYIQRNLSILNCNIVNNRVNANSSSRILSLYPFTNLEFGYNEVYNTVAPVTIQVASTDYIHSIYFHHNKIHDNQSQSGIFVGNGVNLLFEYNEVYNNSTSPAYAITTTIHVTGNHAVIRKNSIHDNTNGYTSALLCRAGFIDISENLFCNNQHLNGLCGYLDGGGALMISTNSPIPPDSSFYKVRNNVFANNYSPFHGGAINIYMARAVIANNQIVNNVSVNGGAIYINDTCALTIKNNLFFGNLTATSHLYPISGNTTSTIKYDHNWSEHSFFQDCGITGYTLASDTLTNIIGVSPDMISPTLTSSITESAVLKNFGLMVGSTCINHGDSTGAFPDSIDYAGNPRLNGIIDIGAYEYYFTSSAPIENASDNNGLTVFPNPASNMVFVTVANENGFLELMDVTGKMVSRKAVAGKQNFIDIRTLKPGLYFVKQVAGGDLKTVTRVIVE